MIEQDGGVDFEARQQKADLKIRDQSDIVRRQNGSAKEHPEEQQLLNEMREQGGPRPEQRAVRL